MREDVAQYASLKSRLKKKPAKRGRRPPTKCKISDRPERDVGRRIGCVRANAVGLRSAQPLGFVHPPTAHASRAGHLRNAHAAPLPGRATFWQPMPLPWDSLFDALRREGDAQDDGAGAEADVRSGTTSRGARRLHPAARPRGCVNSELSISAARATRPLIIEVELILLLLKT